MRISIKYYISFIFMIIICFGFGLFAQGSGRGEKVIGQIKISFDKEEIIADIYENEAGKNLISILPLTLYFDDYNNVEKISKIPKNIATERDVYSHSFKALDIAYYAPWNNVVLFYKDFNYSGSGIIKIGRMRSGLDKLLAAKGKVNIKIEKI